MPRALSISQHRFAATVLDLHADAYDALITDPVEPWVDTVERHVDDAGLNPAAVLDAGCGTGRHARALIDRGTT